ncbi:NAD(P)/FAD-dependent oxidoreductase, partial [Bacillus pumilus]
DYPDLDASRMHICLLDSGDRLLKGMDAGLSARAERDLTELGIKVMKGCRVVDCNDRGVVLQGGDTLEAGLTVWVSGVRARAIGGLPTASIGHAGRILTDRYCRVKG